MRARVLGEFRLEASTGEVDLPSGRVGELLSWLLLRPNELVAGDVLMARLWPDVRGDETPTGTLRTRLQVTVSRLRRFLDAGQGGGLKVVGDGHGYRLIADDDALDRVAFESLAARAMERDPEAAASALALWGGNPYTGFPLSDEMLEQRSRLAELRWELERIRGEQPAASLQARFGRSKLKPPGFDEGWVIGRRRLLDALPRAGDAPLMAVIAPAGYGKSVLLSQWAAAQTCPVAWISLEEGDDDPVRFWSLVGSALVESGAVAPDSVPPDVMPGSARFLERLVEATSIAGSPVGVVLDDFQHIENLSLLDELRRRSVHLSAALTVAIGSRSVLPTAPGESAARRVTVVSADDLRFDDDEVRAVLGLAGADHASVAEVAEVTEGWPVAVSYLARSGAHPSSGLVPGAMEDYLFGEVFAGLPEEVGEFVLGTAHLDRLNASLCDAVTGRDDSGRMLRWLVRRRLFVTGDGADTGWLRYHRLVGEVLAARADADPSIDVAEGHRRAARWYRDQGILEKALAHAIEAGEDDTVAAVAGDVLWDATMSSQIFTCRRWLLSLDPDTLTANRAGHDVAMVCVAGMLSEEEGRPWLESRRRHFGDEPDPLSMFAVEHHLSQRGRYREAIELTEMALTLNDAYFEAHPNLPGFEETVTGTRHAALFMNRVAVGDLGYEDPEVLATIDVMREQHPVVLIWALGLVAFLAYLAGDNEQAGRLVAEVDGHLASMDRDSTEQGAARALLTRALLDSDRTDDRDGQRRIASSVERLLTRYGEAGDTVEVILIRLVLHVVSHRAGDTAGSRLHRAHAEILLEACDPVPFLQQALARLSVDGSSAGPAGHVGAEALTERERTVWDHLAAGLGYARIAEELGVSVDTVRSHASSIYRKLGVRDRLEAARRHPTGR